MSEENMQENQQSQEDLSEILKIRRAKLKDFQDKDCDPFKNSKV